MRRIAACGAAALGILAGCARDDSAPVSVGVPTADLPVGVLVAGASKAWIIETVGTDDEASDRSKPVPTARVVELGAQGEATELDPLTPMFLRGATAAGDTLVVAGAECVGGGDRLDCKSRGIIRTLTDDGWATTVLGDTGATVDENAVYVGGRDRDSVWLRVDFGPNGERDGKMRSIEFDPATRDIVDWSAPAIAAGAMCIFDGVPYDFAFSGGMLSPVDQVPSPKPTDLVATTYEIYEYRDSEWKLAENGRIEAEQARAQILHCNSMGFSTSMPGIDNPSLGWTPRTGWVEAESNPIVNSTAATSLYNLVDGTPIAVAGNALRTAPAGYWELLLETAPGTWEALPLEIERQTYPPLVDVSETIVVGCDITADGKNATGCKIVPRASEDGQ